MENISHTCARSLSHVCEKFTTRVREVTHKDVRRDAYRRMEIGYLSSENVWSIIFEERVEKNA
jgi:hypothetical protein